MPSDIDCHCMAIRGLWLAYDHYSIGSNSYWISKLPELFDLWNPTLGALYVYYPIFYTNFSFRSYRYIVYNLIFFSFFFIRSL